MNPWQRYGAILAVIIPIISGVWWAATNVVLAADYHRYQSEQAVRWLQYDARQLYDEYRDIRRMPSKTPTDMERMSDLEHEMKLKRDAINAARK